MAVLRRASPFLLVLLASSGVACADLETPTEPSPSGCTITLSSEMRFFDVDGGVGTLSVWVPAGCSWTSVATSPWIKIESGDQGEGNGVITFAVEPNCDIRLRTGGIVVVREVMTVLQTGPEEDGPPARSCRIQTGQ